MNGASSMDQVLIEKLTQILEVNFSKENFGVKKLAKEAGLSRSKLHRKLHSIKGTSASRFIREFRLKKALHLLRNNVATASEISYRVGFSSPQYFSKCFHDYYGFTPGEAKTISSKEIQNKPKPSILTFCGLKQLMELQHYRIYFSLKQLAGLSIISVLIVFSIAYFSHSAYYAQKTTSITHTIALIPFKNLSGISENNYLAQGFAIDLINHLSNSEDVIVTSRHSSDKFIDTKKSIRKIGKELNASYLIFGSIQKLDDSVRINIQLIEASIDKQIWTNSYNFKPNEAFHIQNKISEEFAKELISAIKNNNLENY